jgi:hypothetical protein
MEDIMTNEQKGLRLAALVTILSGLALAISAWPPVSGPLRLLTDLVLWPIDQTETLAARETRLLLAIAGGVIAGWALMIWQLAGAPLVRDPGTIRGIVRQSVLTWFVIDSTASIVAGAPLNLLGNLVFVALFLVPLRAGVRTGTTAA